MRVTEDSQIRIQQGHDQRPGSRFLGGQAVANRFLNIDQLLGRKGFGPRSAQRGTLLHHHLVASHRNQRRVAVSFVRDISHRAHARGIQTSQIVGHADAVQQRTARTVDPQADKIRVPVVDVALNHLLHALRRIGIDRAFDRHPDRAPLAPQRRVFLQRGDRQTQRLGQRGSIGGQVLHESQLARRAAREQAQLTRRDDDLFGLDRVPPLQLVQFGAEHELGADFGFDLEHFQIAVEHAQGDLRGYGFATLGDLEVAATNRGVDHLFLVQIDAGVADLGVGRHDDFLAGHRHQHGMPLDGFGDEGHGLGGADPAARKEVGQVERPTEIAPLAELARRGIKLEHQDRPAVSLGQLDQRPLDRALDLRVDAAGDRQRHADQSADRMGDLGRQFRRRALDRRSRGACGRLAGGHNRGPVLNCRTIGTRCRFGRTGARGRGRAKRP